MNSQLETAVNDSKDEKKENKRVKLELQKLSDELSEIKIEKEAVDQVRHYPINYSMTVHALVETRYDKAESARKEEAMG